MYHRRLGADVVVRVLVVKTEGRTHKNIISTLSEPRLALANNHVLPLLETFALDDIICGIFPLAGGSMRDAYNSWTRNSVGDIVNMVAQALEVHSSFIILVNENMILTTTLGSRLYPRARHCSSGTIQRTIILHDLMML